MQKKLIAVAVAGLAAAPLAMAQSNVTIYGIADAALAHTSASGHKNTVIAGGGNLNGNRLGFKGTEDLGGGLKAMFNYELGYTIDAGAAPGGGLTIERQAWVGLGGGFGTVSVGKQYAPGFGASAKYDAMLGTNFSPVEIMAGAVGVGNALGTANMARIQAGGAARTNNSIAYASPNFSGFTGNLIYGFGETATPNLAGNSSSAGSTIGLGLDYTAGPFAVGYVYSSYKMLAAEAADGLPGHKLTENHIGAYYDFGAAKLVGSWQDAKDQSVAANNKSRVWNIGVDVPLGSGVAAFSYADKSVSGNSARDAKSYTLGYIHNLSKRTALYGGVNHTSNKSLVAYGDFSGAGIVADNDPTTWLLGMRHAF
ncbi:MAG: porin [Rhodocyclaceae bacterium]